MRFLIANGCLLSYWNHKLIQLEGDTRDLPVFSLSNSQSLSLSIYLVLSMYLFLCLTLSLMLSLSLFLSLYLSFSLSLFLSFSVLLIFSFTLSLYFAVSFSVTIWLAYFSLLLDLPVSLSPSLSFLWYFSLSKQFHLYQSNGPSITKRTHYKRSQINYFL